MKKNLFIICLILISFGLFAAQQEKFFGSIKVVLHDVSLTQSFYFIDSYTGKPVPIFDTVDLSSNNRFFLKTDINVFNLSKSAGIIGSQRFTDEGFQILYEIKGLATLLFDYVFSASPEAAEGEYDLLNLQVKITNDSKKIQNFALKGVFDTYFGEKTITHFSTKLNPIIVKEMNISNLAEYAWIKSSDSIRSVQFNFFSKANEPTQVRLANKDLLLVQDWDSNGLSGRSFNSVYSYNNSAIALYWPVKRLAYQGSSECRLSISFAQNGLLPFSKDPLAEEEKALEEEVCEEGKFETSVDDRSVQAENPYAYTKPITKEQLDTAYIEALLAKIEALENDDTNIDRTELLKLNAELDAILDMLRK